MTGHHRYRDRSELGWAGWTLPHCDISRRFIQFAARAAAEDSARDSGGPRRATRLQQCHREYRFRVRPAMLSLSPMLAPRRFSRSPRRSAAGRQRHVASGSERPGEARPISSRPATGRTGHVWGDVIRRHGGRNCRRLYSSGGIGVISGTQSGRQPSLRSCPARRSVRGREPAWRDARRSGYPEQRHAELLE